MSSTSLEIVELASGEIVLRRCDEPDAEPLLSLKFSEESKSYLLEEYLQVAKAMFDAGMQELAEATSLHSDDESLEHRVLH